MSGDNQRGTFRLLGDGLLDAVLVTADVAQPCEIVDIGAGGARVVVGSPLASGVRARLRVRLATDAPHGTYTDVPVEVLDSRPDDAVEETASGHHVLRMRSTEPPGSAAYEAAVRLVFDAQRQARARDVGTEDGSPMVSDAERRRRIAPDRSQRFGTGSLRPDRDGR